jgi:propanediol dehydratase small subunit
VNSTETKKTSSVTRIGIEVAIRSAFSITTQTVGTETNSSAKFIGRATKPMKVERAANLTLVAIWHAPDPSPGKFS